jgi:archaemetzincin
MLVLALLLAAAPEHTVAVVPLGDVEPHSLELVKAAIEARADVSVTIEEPRPLPDDAFYKPRKRYRAEKLLDALDGNKAWKVIGVTNAEISTTKGKIFDWGIAGLGNISGQSCVVSLYLYKKHSKTKALFDRRVADLAVHEFGHTLGMPHCETKGCVMSDAKGKAISSADASSGYYCDACRKLAPEGVLKPEIRSP